MRARTREAVRLFISSLEERQPRCLVKDSIGVAQQIARELGQLHSAMLTPSLGSFAMDAG